MKQGIILLMVCMTAMGALPQGRSLMEGDGGARGGAADAKTVQRMSDLEAQVRRLQAQGDDLAVALQQSGGAQRNAASQNEVQALRSEVATLRSENQTLRKNVADLIGQLSQRVDRLEASAAARPSSSGGSGSSGGGVPGGTMTGVEHTVETGQTLSEIAKAYGVKMDTIIKVNNISNPSALRVGQKLFIPQ